MYSRLYLVRHGQTVFNTRHLIQGRCDSPLTSLGCEQARSVARYFRSQDIAIDAAFSSLAERACNTLELIWGAPYVRLAGLRERDFGRLEAAPLSLLTRPIGDSPVPYGAETWRDLGIRVSETMLEIMNGTYDVSFTVSPSDAAVAGASNAPISGPDADADAPRALAGRSDLPIEPDVVVPEGGAPRTSEHGGSVLVLSHGAACKSFASVWEKYSHVAVPDPFLNCTVMVFDFDGERFSLADVVVPAQDEGLI